eukprot:PhF_6_TR4816/c0_g1_i1/m.6653
MSVPTRNILFQEFKFVPKPVFLDYFPENLQKPFAPFIDEARVDVMTYFNENMPSLTFDESVALRLYLGLTFHAFHNTACRTRVSIEQYLPYIFLLESAHSVLQTILLFVGLLWRAHSAISCMNHPRVQENQGASLASTKS